MSTITQDASLNNLFSRFSRKLSSLLGSSFTFVIALTLTTGWLISGPFFGFSTQWSLFINTTTTIFTFLAMFLLQHSQNADTKALHVKLDELINKSDASNKFMRAERLDSETLDVLDREHENGHDDDLDKQRDMYYTMGGE